MGIFGKKKKVTGTYFGEPIFEDDPVSYEQVLGYLVGLSDDEYKQVTQVAEIHRKAYLDSQAVLGEPVEPSTFINPPVPETPTDEPNFLDDDELTNKPGKKIKVQ